MTNPVLNTDDLLKSTLSGRLKDGHTPDELVETIAGAPPFSLGAYPRTTEQVQDRLSVLEDLCLGVVQPVLVPDSEFEIVFSEMSSVLRTELMRHVKTDEGVSKWNEWADDVQYLLKDYPSTFKYEAAVLLSLKAQLGDTLDITEDAIKGLVINLDSTDTIVQRSYAKALADVSSEHSDIVAPYLDQLFEHIVCGRPEVQQELLTAVVWTTENTPPRKLDIENELLTELGRYCLVKTEDSLTQTLAVRLLSRIADIEPDACSSAITALFHRQNDPNPDIADLAESTLSKLNEADIALECAGRDQKFLPAVYECCTSKSTGEQPIECPSISDACSDWALMSDGNSLDSAKKYRRLNSNPHPTNCKTD